MVLILIERAPSPPELVLGTSLPVLGVFASIRRGRRKTKKKTKKVSHETVQ